MYQIIRTITPQECPWLDRTYEIGEVVYKYSGHTYGCIGKNASAFCKSFNSTPFFQLPNDAVLIIETL